MKIKQNPNHVYSSMVDNDDGKEIEICFIFGQCKVSRDFHQRGDLEHLSRSDKILRDHRHHVGWCCCAIFSLFCCEGHSC